MARARSSTSTAPSTANLGFEATRPDRKGVTADTLRDNRDVAVTELSDKRRQRSEPVFADFATARIERRLNP